MRAIFVAHVVWLNYSNNNNDLGETCFWAETSWRVTKGFLSCQYDTFVLAQSFFGISRNMVVVTCFR